MSEISLSASLKHYKRPEIQEEIFYNAKDREVAIKYDYGFGKRPDTLQYPTDVLEFAKKKATSFHISEEIWKNPYHISSGMKPKDLDNLRKGWDLVLDIDGIFEFSKIVASLVIELLNSFEIKAVSCKFSGNKGFHIGVPFESFPSEVHGRKVEELFPEAPRRVAAYIWDRIEKKLSEEILRRYSLEKIEEMTALPRERLTIRNNDGTLSLNTKALVDIDTVLISSRHLYRSAYSFNEKSGLVSIPIKPERVESFSKLEARPNNVRVSKFRFLDREASVPGEAKKLFEAAYDWTFDEKAFMKEELRERTKGDRNYEADELTEAIPEEYFPPCIKLLLAGIGDGKKRGLFILTNFLKSVGWDNERIEEKILEWNKKNENELKEGIVLSHLRYHKTGSSAMPPNCDNEGYYKNIGVCKPDSLCARIKNPVQYSKIRIRYADKEDKDTEKIEKSGETEKKAKRKVKKKPDHSDTKETQVATALVPSP